MADPWFKFFPSDWLAGTRGLSAAETGVYITLICMMQEREAPIVMDDTRLARLCGLPARNFRRALEALIDQGKVIEKDGGLWNERVGETLLERQKTISVRSRSASSRWEKIKEKQGEADAKAMQVHTEARSQKSDIKETPNGVSKKQRGTRLPDDWFLPRAWGEWAQAEGFSAGTIRTEADKFKDYWIAQPGQRGVKRDWLATWRNWMRNSNGKRTGNGGGHAATDSFLAGWGLGGDQNAGGGASDSAAMRDVTPPGDERMAAGADWDAAGAILRFPTAAGNGQGNF